MAIASLHSVSTHTVSAILQVLNDAPINANIDIQSISSDVDAHVQQNPGSILHGGSLVIIGIALFILGQVIFLSSFTVTYGASDIAKSYQASEKSPLISTATKLDAKGKPLAPGDYHLSYP